MVIDDVIEGWVNCDGFLFTEYNSLRSNFTGTLISREGGMWRRTGGKVWSSTSGEVWVNFHTFNCIVNCGKL